MLSIGKLGAGQARYYLDQAQGRVDVVDSVADGIEDYYVGGAEARGEWIGAAARELGLRGRRIHLDWRFLAEPTAAGDAPLVHGYAITGHIAQGLTVDRTYVLATDGIDREWAYVALSRGRHSNRLYLTAEPDNDRAEYAPAGPSSDPIERLARQLEHSSAQVLAIDSGQRVESVEQATLGRRRLEQRRFAGSRGDDRSSRLLGRVKPMPAASRWSFSTGRIRS